MVIGLFRLPRDGLDDMNALQLLCVCSEPSELEFDGITHLDLFIQFLFGIGSDRLVKRPQSWLEHGKDV